MMNTRHLEGLQWYKHNWSKDGSGPRGKSRKTMATKYTQQDFAIFPKKKCTKNESMRLEIMKCPSASLITNRLKEVPALRWYCVALSGRRFVLNSSYDLFFCLFLFVCASDLLVQQHYTRQKSESRVQRKCISINNTLFIITPLRELFFPPWNQVDLIFEKLGQPFFGPHILKSGPRTKIKIKNHKI